MFGLVPILLLSTALVILTNLLYYEILRFTWAALPKLTWRPRLRVIFVILAIFGGHTLMVWLYGAVYWLLPQLSGWGEFITFDPTNHLQGAHDGSFTSALYFSAATYSSLGFGDIVPTGDLRILSGIEVLNGLVLIGWSISFTYLAMEKFWVMHRRK